MSDQKTHGPPPEPGKLVVLGTGLIAFLAMAKWQTRGACRDSPTTREEPTEVFGPPTIAPAAVSDRPDHGSMWAYDAWPPLTVDAMCALGYWEDAIAFLRRTQAAIYEGVYAQAREFYGPTRGQYDAPVRIAQREGCMRECTGGGAFAETIIGTLFGYAAKPGIKFALMGAEVRRGFRGELRHVRYGSELLRIRSGDTGVDLRKET